MAYRNGIENYIAIDCSISELQYIKNNILDSELNKLFDLNKVDWIKCGEYALKNKVKEVCDYYNAYPGIFSSDLAKNFDMHKTTIIDYLNIGTKLGWCKYDGKEELRRSGKRNGGHNRKPVSQFTLDKSELINTYSSIKEAENKTGIKHIGACCRGKRKTAGGYVWRYLE